MTKRSLVVYLAMAILGCHTADAGSPMHFQAASMTMDTSAIERELGFKGSVSEGAFKATLPRQDLRVAVDGFPITPRMGLTAWVAFQPHGPKAMLMGDLPVAQDELQPVLTALMNNGVDISGLHNHFLGEDTRIMFLHVGGMGDPVALARGVRAAFDAIRKVRAAGSPTVASPAPVSDLDIERLNAIIGATGDYQDGVYKVTVPRPKVPLTEMGVPVTSTMGFNSWAAIAGTKERAGVSGDLAMLADEVNPVVHAFRRAGINVVAIHNHMLREEPRIFFLHYWGVGQAEDLARGVRAALDQLSKP